MSSKTVALERSTYERLKGVRRSGESFTDTVNRLLAGKEPSLLDFVGLIPKEDAEDLAHVIEEMRAEDEELERGRLKGNRVRTGGRARGRHL